MTDADAPYHAHVYYEPAERPIAAALHRALEAARDSGQPARVLFVGRLMDRPVGPHPLPQFEAHFPFGALDALRPLFEATGLRTLLHPLTQDDVADHTNLATWIGTPVPLDLSVLDPPGHNQAIPRYGASDF